MNELYLRPPLDHERKLSISAKSQSQSHFYKNSTDNASSMTSFTSSMNDYMMSFNKDMLPNENFEFYPRILHIPGTITCQNDFSWGLWNWIHSKDDTLQENVYRDRYPSEEETITFTKTFTSDGQPFELNPSFDHHPKHFHIERNTIPTPKSEAIANRKSSTLNQYVNAAQAQASSNKPLLKGIPPTTIPRFYIHVLSFKGEHVKNVSSICCSIEINKKEIFTGIAPCIKNNDGTVTAQFNEAFIFDAPSMDFSIHVNVYGLYHKVINKSFIHNLKETLNKKNDSSKAIKPSYTGVFRNYHLNSNDFCFMDSEKSSGPKNSPLTKSISIISNTFSLKKGHNKKDSSKKPHDHIDQMGKEIFIGDMEMQFSVQKVDKTTTTYKLKPVVIQNPKTNGPPIVSKFQHNVIIQTGIYMDEKVKETIAYINENIYCDYLSVQLSTTTVPVWKRYWVIFKENFLTFYDFEYKEKKEPIGKIDIHTLKSLGLPNPEFNSMPNCFCIEFKEGKDLSDIVGVFQKEGDYNEKISEEEQHQLKKKYARIKPKEELTLRKEEEVGGHNTRTQNQSNINSNNTLYSSKHDGINDKEKKEKEEEEEKKKKEAEEEEKEEEKLNISASGITDDKKDETLNSLDNVAINLDTIENMIKNMEDHNNDVGTSNNTLHQQEMIPHYEWINRVVTKSTAYFYTDSPSKLTQWMKIIEESPCFQISK